VISCLYLTLRHVFFHVYTQNMKTLANQFFHFKKFPHFTLEPLFISVYPLAINLINQRFIVWKLNNTNVDWKNTVTVLNCVSAIWQDEEDRPPISIFWASPCFVSDSESYNPLWNLERYAGHDPHTIANIYYPELSGYFKEFKPSSDSGSDSDMQRRTPFTNMKVQIPVVPQEKIIEIWAHVKCGDRRVPSSSCHIPPNEWGKPHSPPCNPPVLV
jgi:hypothetical protein